MNEFQAEVLLKEQNALAIYRDCIQLRDSLMEDAQNQEQNQALAQDENQDNGLQEKNLEDTNRIISEYDDKYTIAYQSLVQLIINQKDN